MKKLRVVLTSVVLGVLVFVLASCGGAGGAISSVVNNVKKLDYEKASEYCLDADAVKALQADEEKSYTGLSEDVVKDLKAVQKKIYGEFKFKVTETTMSSDETTATVKITYTTLDITSMSKEIETWVKDNVTLGDMTSAEGIVKASIDAINACWGSREKSEEKTATIALTNKDGDWKVDSGVALIALMTVDLM